MFQPYLSSSWGSREGVHYFDKWEEEVQPLCQRVTNCCHFQTVSWFLCLYIFTPFFFSHVCRQTNGQPILPAVVDPAVPQAPLTEVVVPLARVVVQLAPQAQDVAPLAPLLDEQEDEVNFVQEDEEDLMGLGYGKYLHTPLKN